jgi:predicted glycosyltransferase
LTLFDSSRTPAKRLLFYSHDGIGLGHMRRNLAIARAVTEADPTASVLLATSADEVDEFDIPASVDVLKLPGVRKLADGEYGPRRLQVSKERLCSVRSALLAAAAETFQPDLILVDKHPFGLQGELRPALRAVRDSGAVAVLGMRDILDEPRRVRMEWAGRGIMEEVARTYSRILVYGEQRIFDFVRAYRLPRSAATLVRYCGYVVNPPMAAHLGGEQQLGRAGGDLPIVLATAGGGADGYELLRTFVDASRGAPWQATLVAGRQGTSDERERLRERAGLSGVGFRDFLPGVSGLFTEVDALVCMGGYNTLVEAAGAGVATVCVPRVAPRLEQLIRARSFEQLGLLRTLDPAGLNPVTLRGEIARALRAEPGRRPSMPSFDGATRSADLLLTLAERARVVPSSRLTAVAQ